MPLLRTLLPFNREPVHQRAARSALAPAALAGAFAYLALDALLTPLLGGVWGVLVSLWMVTVPIGALWWSGESAARGWAKWRAGLAFGSAAVALYAWVFIGSWR